MTNWVSYAYCDTCQANEGKPCRDLRYADRMGRFYRRRPHKGRQHR